MNDMRHSLCGIAVYKLLMSIQKWSWDEREEKGKEVKRLKSMTCVEDVRGEGSHSGTRTLSRCIEIISVWQKESFGKKVNSGGVSGGG